ncbi:MAG: hypothetical protein RLZZ591_530 [Pseudomonadota bacterium]|jgi:hypothetical protein
MKNKTIATWLSFLGGPLGLHRFYLRGPTDLMGWMLPIPSALGLYGIERAQQLGLDDQYSWLLIPLLGFTIAGCALNAIVIGLTSTEKWNARYNLGADDQDPAGRSGWPTIIGVGCALLIGTTILMSSVVFSFQRYFEYQIEESKKLSQ